MNSNRDSGVLIYAPPHYLGNMGDRVVTRVAQKYFPNATYLYDNYINYLFANPSAAKIFFSPHRKKATLKIAQLIRRYQKFILFGMDGIDGHYDLRESISKLRLASEFALKGRQSWVINFSWNSSNIVPELKIELYRAQQAGVNFVARDSISARRLTQLGITARIVNDLAFLALDVIEPEKRFFEKETAIERFVVLSPSRSFGQLQSQVDQFARIIPFLRLKGLQPIIFTSVTNFRIGDKRIAKKINHILESKSEQRLAIISSENQLLQILTSTSFVITARMHSAIVALSSQIPVFILEYQGKVAGMMEDLNLTEHFRDIPVISENEINQIIRDETKIKKILEMKIPSFKNQAEKLMNEILKTN
jgi:polysaccharide pyruvyl transferase WcaK-like protein